MSTAATEPLTTGERRELLCALLDRYEELKRRRTQEGFSRADEFLADFKSLAKKLDMTRLLLEDTKP